MLILTDEYNSDYYVFGDYIYFRIDVTNPGTYTIDVEAEFGSTAGSVMFYSLASDKSYSGKSTYLMEGTYTVRLSTSGPLSRIKVKYSYEADYNLGFYGVTNDLQDYKVINIFLDIDEEYDIPIYDIFNNSKIEIYDFSINILQSSIISVDGSKIKGIKGGSRSIYVTLFEAFTKKVYTLKLVNVYVEDSSTAIEIRTFKDLLEINNNLSGNYVLNADIDLSGIDWIPIGTIQNTGMLINPDGYTISNLECSETRCGLFEYIKNGYVSGLKLKDININALANEYGYSYAGGIAVGIHSSTIYNSSVTGIINTSSDAGGIVGSNSWGQIINCSFEGSITVSGNVGGIAGGIVGSNTTDDRDPGISGNVVKANIVSTYYAGGISGRGRHYGGFSNNSFEGTLDGLFTNEQFNN